MKKALYILFSFSGRIGRGDFWFGFWIVIMTGLLGTVVIQPDYFRYDVVSDSYPPPSLSVKIFDLIMVLPSFAITVKRLNDRDWARWVFFALVLIWLPIYIGPFVGLFLEIGTGTSIEMIWWAIVIIVTICLLVDNGFLRGTKGTNRYGNDPL